MSVDVRCGLGCLESWSHGCWREFCALPIWAARKGNWIVRECIVPWNIHEIVGLVFSYLRDLWRWWR